MADIKLYSYFRSSAAYRVRVSLHWKELEFDYEAVHLVKDGGEQHQAPYTEKNPMAELPTLVHNDRILSQSLPILLYLDDMFPEKPLFPSESFERAKVIQLCEIINSGIHPVQNLKVLQELERRFSLSAEGKKSWAHDWIARGFHALEKTLQTTSGQYSFGKKLTAADAFLVPQVYNARRFEVDLEKFPLISRIEEECMKLDAFQKARPEAQPDWPKEK